MAKRRRPGRALARFSIPAILATVALVAVLPAARPARAQESLHPIVAAAYQYEGQWVGQCWPFVREMVYEATGLTMGYDYRLGFFDAGAWEVPIEEARQGDVIQLADDSYTLPDADYPGLHTAIIVEAPGDGTFTVIDANSQWDGVVRVRSGYDPAASAARFANIDWHIYRFPLPGESPAAPSAFARPNDSGADVDAEPPSLDLTPVDEQTFARVTADGDCLNFRTGPGLDYGVFTCLPDGKTVIDLGAEPVVADGFTWVHVATLGGRGWVASEFLTPVEPETARAAATKPEISIFISTGADSPEDEAKAAGEEEEPTLFRTTVAAVSAGW